MHYDSSTSTIIIANNSTMIVLVLYAINEWVIPYSLLWFSEWYRLDSVACAVVKSRLLLFIPTTAVFKYIVKTTTSSLLLHLDEMQCGMSALNMRKSPGRSGTTTPNVGKQKCVTISSSTWHVRWPFRKTWTILMVKSSSVWHGRNTFRPYASAPKYLRGDFVDGDIMDL